MAVWPGLLSLSARRAWIEIANFCKNRFCPTSLSARRAWIEIINNNYNDLTRPVALRKESVDRNWRTASRWRVSRVALRKESVDRNLWWGVRKAVGSLVALRKESVDRNINPPSINCMTHVALRKESVDRNWFFVALKGRAKPSLSARRAWIEMTRYRISAR